LRRGRDELFLALFRASGLKNPEHFKLIIRELRRATGR